MGIFEMLVLALALSMDAFSVAISKGLAAKTVRLRHMITVGLWFGAMGSTKGAALLSKKIPLWIKALFVGKEKEA